MIRLSELWAAVKARLAGDATLTQVLGGANRVYLAAEVPLEAPTNGGQLLMRLVLTPVLSVLPDGEYDAEDRKKRVRFLVRTEHSQWQAQGYQVNVALEAAQARAYKLLDQWAPPPGAYARTLIPLACTRPAQAMPMWDNQRLLWVLTSEWAVEVVSGPSA